MPVKIQLLVKHWPNFCNRGRNNPLLHHLKDHHPLLHGHGLEDHYLDHQEDHPPLLNLAVRSHHHLEDHYLDHQEDHPPLLNLAVRSHLNPLRQVAIVLSPHHGRHLQYRLKIPRFLSLHSQMTDQIPDPLVQMMVTIMVHKHLQMALRPLHNFLLSQMRVTVTVSFNHQDLYLNRDKYHLPQVLLNPLLRQLFHPQLQRQQTMVPLLHQLFQPQLQRQQMMVVPLPIHRHLPLHQAVLYVPLIPHNRQVHLPLFLLRQFQVVPVRLALLPLQAPAHQAPLPHPLQAPAHLAPPSPSPPGRPRPPGPPSPPDRPRPPGPPSPPGRPRPPGPPSPPPRPADCPCPPDPLSPSPLVRPRPRGPPPGRPRPPGPPPGRPRPPGSPPGRPRPPGSPPGRPRPPGPPRPPPPRPGGPMPPCPPCPPTTPSPPATPSDTPSPPATPSDTPSPPATPSDTPSPPATPSDTPSPPATPSDTPATPSQPPTPPQPSPPSPDPQPSPPVDGTPARDGVSPLPLGPDPLNFEVDAKQLKVCFLRFFLNGTTEADFSPRIDEFEAVIGESLYVAVQKNIMLYYTAMVAEIQHVPSETIVTVSVSTIMNKTAPLQLDSAAAVAVYVSSLIMHDVGNFAKHNFSIRSIYILDSGSGETVVISSSSSSGDKLSGGVLAGIVILGLIATLMAITVVLMIVYVRYATVRRTPDQESSPLIPNNEYQRINHLDHKDI